MFTLYSIKQYDRAYSICFIGPDAHALYLCFYVNLYAMGFYARLLRSAVFFSFFPSLPWQRIKSMKDYDVFVVLTSRHYLYVCSCTARVISARGRENLVEEKSIIVPNFKATRSASHYSLFQYSGYV